MDQNGHYKKNEQTKSWRGCEEKGTLFHCWWECKLIQPLWRTVWRFFKKLGIKLPYDPAIPLLGIYPEKTIIEKDTCTPVFIAALFTTALEEEMATYSSILTWRIPWTGEQALGLQGAGHDLATIQIYNSEDMEAT